MIEYEDMEQPEEIETNQNESKIESGYVETNEHGNMNTRTIRANAGKGVEHPNMKFGGKTYDTKFANSTGKKKKYFMHDMHKLSVDVTFIHMTFKKGTKNHG